MVCVKKTKSAATAIATAASTIYQNYTGSGASPIATGAPQALVADASTTATSASSAATSAANAGIKGFNYGAFFMDYTAKKQADFEYEFARAQDLTNTTGWNSARLYTMGKYHFDIWQHLGSAWRGI